MDFPSWPKHFSLSSRIASFVASFFAVLCLSIYLLQESRNELLPFLAASNSNFADWLPDNSSKETVSSRSQPPNLSRIWRKSFDVAYSQNQQQQLPAVYQDPLQDSPLEPLQNPLQESSPASSSTLAHTGTEERAAEAISGKPQTGMEVAPPGAVEAEERSGANGGKRESEAIAEQGQQQQQEQKHEPSELHILNSIPGSKLTSPSSVRHFRRRIACLASQGRWLYDPSPRILPWPPGGGRSFSHCDSDLVQKHKAIAGARANKVVVEGGREKDWKVRSSLKYVWKVPGSVGCGDAGGGGGGDAAGGGAVGDGASVAGGVASDGTDAAGADAGAGRASVGESGGASSGGSNGQGTSGRALGDQESTNALGNASDGGSPTSHPASSDRNGALGDSNEVFQELPPFNRTRLCNRLAATAGGILFVGDSMTGQLQYSFHHHMFLGVHGPSSRPKYTQMKQCKIWEQNLNEYKFHLCEQFNYCRDLGPGQEVRVMYVRNDHLSLRTDAENSILEPLRGYELPWIEHLNDWGVSAVILNRGPILITTQRLRTLKMSYKLHYCAYANCTRSCL
ncbi:hypothetical protein CLOP_g10239 [Closterium sp. NIES-67]|nr:hypothetical protein CLOP_g10239 [Closterium sp. NIES-67]